MRLGSRVALVAAAMACAACGVAAAADDGGTRSPFSFGAGPRALAMGSAYVAVADDATATMWNSAGLGRITRSELQASQASYFGLQITDSYAALVWPDWRWGAVAGTLRHFGASGIERRDERNAVIEGEITDSETELAVGYGRALGEAWSVGGTIKTRRHTLAGLTGTGMGLDVGATVRPAQVLPVRWLEDVTVGMSIVNLLEPSIKLVRESVSDPTLVRAGFAVQRPVLGHQTLLATVDLERPRLGNTRLHAGLELRLLSMLAVRTGLNGSALTAGSGLEWRNLSVDYVYLDQALEPAHRVALSWAFGSTVQESRARHVREEEAALEARLAEAFQKRLDEEIATLLARAEELRAGRQHDDALEALAAVATLQPQHPKARALELAILMDRAAQLEAERAYSEAVVVYDRVLALAPGDSAATAARARSVEAGEQVTARSEDLRARYERAVEALSADRLIDAQRGFKGILESNPMDPDATRMLQNTEQAIARRVDQLLVSAERSLHAGFLQEAERMVAEATALDPRAKGLAAVQTSILKARRAAARGTLAQEARPTPARTSTLKPREVATFYQRALAAARDRRADEALRYLELVWSADPKYQQVAEHLKREYLMRGMESFGAGRLDEAVGYWQKALDVDPNDTRAAGYLARARAQISRTREILGGGR